jgi:hypothetical protein
MTNEIWKTPMRANVNGTDEDQAARAADRLRGQAAALLLDGDRIQLLTMPDRGCFSTDAVISRDDALGLWLALGRLVNPGNVKYPKGTPEYDKS